MTLLHRIKHWLHGFRSGLWYCRECGDVQGMETIVLASPSALDTLRELQEALDNDPPYWKEYGPLEMRVMAHLWDIKDRREIR